MNKNILHPLTLSFGLCLATACPGDPGVTSDTDTTDGETDSTTEVDPTNNPSTPSTPSTPTMTMTEVPTTGDPDPTLDPTTTTTETATESESESATESESDTETETETDTDIPDDNLCTRLGGPGEGGIQDLVINFIGVAVTDQRINGYFLNDDVDGGNLITQVTDQLGEAAGCPGVVYNGLDMVTAHAELGISTNDFGDFAEDFQVALDDHQTTHPTLTDDDKVAIMTVLGGMAGDIIEDTENNLTVYQRVGRKPAIVGLIGEPTAEMTFVGVVAQNPAINTFFAASDFERLNTCLARQVSSIDGPIKYGQEVDSPGPGIDPGVSLAAQCLDMETSHIDLLDADQTTITFDDFGALVGDLITAMNNFAIPEDDQLAILGALGPLCDQIVVGAEEKNKCPGNTVVDVLEENAINGVAADGAYNGTVETMFCQTFNVEEGINFVTDLELQVGIANTWVGDLVIKVFSPQNTELTVLSRPGLAEAADDGTGCCGDSSNIVPTHPIIFKNNGQTNAESMGSTIPDGQAVCQDDNFCEYAPNSGAAPGTDFLDFLNENAVGEWRVCVGDSNGGDLTTVDMIRLTFTKSKFLP